MASSLKDVLNGDLCTGCGGCAALAPDAFAMGYEASGMLRPRPLRPVTDREEVDILSVCPGAGQTHPMHADECDLDWGPLQTLVKGYATDADLRLDGASGGALSGLLLSLLETGDVDGILHIKADPDHPLQNVTTLSFGRDGILEAAGSRYAPSRPLDRVLEASDSGKRFAFVGKPCDVAALSAWRKNDARVAASFPILISFLCAGTPSLNGAAEVVTTMGLQPEALDSFAYRGPGWPGRATGHSKQGETQHMSYAASWGKILSRHVQHRCKVCADGAGVHADIVFGDIWDAGDDGYPSFEDRPGQSAILARTQLGVQLLMRSAAANHLALAPLDVKTLTAMQPGQIRRRRVLLARLAGLWLLRRPFPRYRGFRLVQSAKRTNPLALLRNFLGMTRRAIAIPRKGRGTC